MDDPIRYISAAETCRRVGNITTVTLWRWLKNEDLKFPRPSVINKRRYFDEAEIARWVAERRRPAPGYDGTQSEAQAA
jgi:predicted DNA-binding transcriptional regulator AlpA